MCLAIIYQSIIHGCSKGVLEFTIKVTPIIGYTFVCLSLKILLLFNVSISELWYSRVGHGDIGRFHLYLYEIDF